MANESEIAKRLIERGEVLFKAARRTIQFTDDPEANRLVNDLEEHPHAFVIGCVMNRQIPAQRAWFIPHHIATALGTFSIGALDRLSSEEIMALMSTPRPLHRFVATMSESFYRAVKRIVSVYRGDASRIWIGNPSSADVVYRFLEFDGVGPKIATMAANILARQFKVPLSDYASIDVSADLHVRRVFGRLGLCATNATVDQVTYRARALNPTFPGMLDSPCWEIGRAACAPRRPRCADCYMRDLCPTAGEQT